MASVSCLLNNLAQAEIVIPSNCIGKYLSRFGREVEGAMSFDQTEEVIVDKMPIDFSPMSYNLCVNDEGQLKSFQWTYANADRSKQYRMTRVGMKGGNCEDIDIPDHKRGMFDVARVFRDSDQIVKIVLFSTETATSWTLGQADTSDENDQRDYIRPDDVDEDRYYIVGFWGQYTEDAITKIGVIAADDWCVDDEGIDKEIK